MTISSSSRLFALRLVFVDAFRRHGPLCRNARPLDFVRVVAAFQTSNLVILKHVLGPPTALSSGARPCDTSLSSGRPGRCACEPRTLVHDPTPDHRHEHLSAANFPASIVPSPFSLSAYSAPHRVALRNTSFRSIASLNFQMRPEPACYHRLQVYEEQRPPGVTVCVERRVQPGLNHGLQLGFPG